MVRKTVAVASVPPFSSQRLEGKISVARSPPPRPLTAVSFSNGQRSGGGADLGLERFIGTVHVSARGKVWRTVSDRNFEWRGNREESPGDRAVTVRERVLIKGQPGSTALEVAF